MSAWFRRIPVRSLTDGHALLLWPAHAPAPFALSPSAHAIWNALEYPATVADVASAVAAEWDTTEDVVTADVASFIATLDARGLVTRSDEPPSTESILRSRYLGLLKRALANVLQPEHELRIRALLDRRVGGHTPTDRVRWLRDIRTEEAELFSMFSLYRRVGAVEALNMGFMPPSLVGLSGLDNIEHCAERVMTERVAGDFLEAGVAGGGAAVFLRAVQVAHGESDRRLWLADSFQGLPAAADAADVAMGLDLTEPSAPLLAASADTVRATFGRYGLLDRHVRFLEGWFSDTLPQAPIERLAILRIDADMHRSTLDVLEALYDRVSAGGFVIVDDYGPFPPCRQAVDEFRAARRIADPIAWVDADRIYWRKT